MSRIFVQFLHPGNEPRYDDGEKGVIPWNRDEKHVRKCFHHPVGVWEPSKGSQKTPAPMYFWGEWEAPSSYNKIESDEPVAVHYPKFPEEPETIDRHANTDPFVFGGNFVYTNCHQGVYRSLRELDEGSIIAFGSGLSGKFLLDTVIVVGKNKVVWTPGGREWTDLIDSEAYRIATIHVLKDRQSPEAVYRGVTADESDTLFSFVPCGRKPFARPSLPTLESEGLISPGMTQGIKKTPLGSVEKSREVWKMIVDDVSGAGLHLGTNVAPVSERLSND